MPAQRRTSSLLAVATALALLGVGIGGTGADATPDPHPATAPLQVTELLPDSRNVGGADGYEFIEIYNATTEPIDLADYTLVYLYPQDSSINTNEATWPLVPPDAVVQAGDTVVIWVKNGQNDDLDDEDFNAAFGTDLTLGVDLLEVFAGGMANGAARGVSIRTNTGFELNRAYYNMAGADDVSADLGIRYGTTPGDSTLQQLLDVTAPTPGAVQPDQVPEALLVTPPDTQPPAVDDLTVEEIDPAVDLTIEARITDDVQVRTVTLELRNDVDADVRTVNLRHDPDDPQTYRYTVITADLIGKDSYSYRLRVSDGTRTIVTDEVTLPVTGRTDEPLRLSIADGALLHGTVAVTAAGDRHPATLELSIDGARLAATPSLEAPPVFVFAESQTDFYFRNGVRIGEEVLLVFDLGSYGETFTQSTPVPLAHVKPGEPLVVSVWAGTKAGPWMDEAENNDDFVISQMRLVLPDGRTLVPDGYDDPTEIIQMGDTTGKHDVYDSVFTIPEDAYVGRSYSWDTTQVSDGEHLITAVDGEDAREARVTVDNTPPTIGPSLIEGRTYQGEFAVDAEVDDVTSGVAHVSAMLDGEPIDLGSVTSSVALAPGEHVLEVSATDQAGNTAMSTTRFVTPEERPAATELAPVDRTVVAPGEVTLQARVQDPTGDELTVGFYEGQRFDLEDPEVLASSGTTADALALDRSGAATGTAPLSSGDALPYHLFEVAVPDEAGPEARVRLAWQGQAEPGADLLLYALAADGGSWVEVDRATAREGGPVSLGGTVALADHARDGVVTALVQHSEGYASPDRSDRSTVVAGGHPDDVPRSAYDATIAWESDTQYYNEQFIDHQVAIHDYLLERRDDLNVGYLIHTGDIVDDYDQPCQWENASPQYARLDEAGLPYGVLAGNHDVGNHLADYSAFSTHFGEARYAGSPWYGGSFEDNRGHYDLISVAGIDFLMLYMGWDPGEEAIAWMNDVLARYPNRVAVLNLHEYMLTTGGLGPIPQRILDEVVAPNPNVRMVLSGHYHDAFTRVDTFDDDGDGVDDRSVYAMLFDYQGLPEGGLGYLRLLHLDNEGERLLVRTYSPSLQVYNSDHVDLLGPADDPYLHQDFDIAYADLGIAPRVRTLASTSFEVEVLTETPIGAASPIVDAASRLRVPLIGASRVPIASGEVVSQVWTLAEAGEHGWYVRTADPFGAVDESAVRTVVVAGQVGSELPDGGPAPEGDGGSSAVAPPGDDPTPLATTGTSGVLTGLLLAGLAIGLGVALRARARRAGRFSL